MKSCRAKLHAENRSGWILAAAQSLWRESQKGLGQSPITSTS